MNDEVTKKLIEWFEAARAVAAEQVPDVAAQIVRLAIFTGGLQLVVGLALGIAAHAAWRKYAATRRDEEGGWVALAGVLFFVAIPLTSLGAFDLGQALLAPKVVVLKYVGALR